jgi:hypothetical protein
MKKISLLATALVLLTSLAFAIGVQSAANSGKPQDLTGKELLDKMTSSMPGDHMYALGYVSGVYAVIKSQGVVPNGPTAEALLEIVKRYLQKNKDVLDHPASELVIAALKQDSAGK